MGDVLDDTFTDAYAVLQDGVLVAEDYQPTGGPHQTHAVMSVTKSVVGCVAGILADRGAARPDPRRRGLRPRARPRADTRAPPSSTCSTCAAGFASARSTRTRTPRFAGSTGGSRPAPPRPGERARGLYPVPRRTACRGAAREPVPLPLGGDRRARLGLRAGWSAPDGGPDLDPGLGADGCRTGRRDHLRRARHGRARRRSGRRPLATCCGSGRCCWTGEWCPTRTAVPGHRRTPQVAAPGLGRRLRGPDELPRLAGGGVLPGRLVPEPVLVPSR